MAAIPPSEVLVVEDEYLVALDVQTRVEQMGHRATVVYTAEQAVEVAAIAHFDLILMDIKLGTSGDGVDAAQAIRRAHDIPIVYLTAFADNATLERARCTEPYGYVVKPFQERELQAAIEIALQRHGSDRERSEQQRLQRFLAEASARLATSLDYRAVAHDAADVIVPTYADWCLIHLRESGQAIPALTYSHPGPDGNDTAGAAQLIEAVEHQARSRIVGQLPEPGTLGRELGREHAKVLRDLGVRSLVCAPLIARGRVLGSLAMASGHARPRYGHADLAFVEDLAQRLAFALDNALLFREAERALQSRDDVLAIVSHDLRTPLGTILLQVDVLAANPGLRATADRIRRAANRMHRLIGDLLDASAIEASKLTLEVQSNVAGDLVQEAIEMFLPEAGERGIQLVAEIDDSSARVICDRDRILQVLGNLIGNALKFTPKAGTVCVAAVRAGDDIRFEVRDTGAGIPAEQISRLFERFWRAKARRDGGGLGLFIASGIVGAHGQTLEVDSRVGVGSRFYFSLPRSA